jgi:hypothetical protein
LATLLKRAELAIELVFGLEKYHTLFQNMTHTSRFETANKARNGPLLTVSHLLYLAAAPSLAATSPFSSTFIQCYLVLIVPRTSTLGSAVPTPREPLPDKSKA